MYICCQVIRHFDGCRADLVVYDAAPDGKLALLDKWSITILHVFMVLLFLTLLWMIAVTGLHDMDEFVQSQLILAVGIFFSVSAYQFRSDILSGSTLQYP